MGLPLLHFALHLLVELVNTPAAHLPWHKPFRTGCACARLLGLPLLHFARHLLVGLVNTPALPLPQYEPFEVCPSHFFFSSS